MTLQLIIGKTYRGKKPLKRHTGEMNDRTIVWLGQYTVQYDGPAVSNGRHYPTVTHEAFLAWAGEMLN